MYQLREEKKRNETVFSTFKNSRRLKGHEPQVIGCLHLGKKKKKKLLKKINKTKKITLFCEEFGTEQGYV